MKHESEAISADETLVRLVWWTFYSADAAQPIARGAFEPKKLELDGISLYRLACLRDVTQTLEPIKEPNRAHYVFAYLLVNLALNIGLTIEPAPTTIPGHVVIPQLSRPAYDADRKRAREFMIQLAQMSRLTA